MNQAAFESVVAAQVEAFAQTPAYRKLRNQTLTLQDYHDVLLAILPQTLDGPVTFALAAGFVPPAYPDVRSYLLHHAEEEKLHWQWVIEDLAHTGYRGPDPLTSFPTVSAAAYVAYNYSVAMRFPVGRLAIAATLESIGARYGGDSARRLMTQLNLQPHQVRFFEGHGDTDIGHTQDILDVLQTCSLSPDDWHRMCHIAEVAGHLYRQMYTEKFVCTA